MVAEAGRAETLKRFLDTFKTENPHRAEAKKMLAAFLPGSLLVKTEPKGALVSIDSKPIGQSPVGRELKDGEHQVAATLEGYLPKAQKVKIESGSQAEILLTLEAPPAHPFSTWGHVTLWTGLGATLFGGGAGFIMMKEWDDYRETGDEDHRKSSDLWHGLMIGGLVAGGALMATGIILWILEPSRADWAREVGGESGVSILPMSDGSGMVFSLSGSF
jgi:hypothetical protein